MVDTSIPLIRAARPEDYERIAQIKNQTSPETITVEGMKKSDAERKEGDFLCRFVAVRNGEILGVGQIWRSIWNPPGRYLLNVSVDRKAERQGLGKSLLAPLEDAGREVGATEFESLALDSSRSGISFLSARGYGLVALVYESKLDLQEFSPASFSWPCPPHVNIFSFGETAQDEEAKRRLWELNTTVSRDEPQNDPNHVPSFKDYCENVISAHWFDPNGQFLAELDGRWIGLSAVGQVFKGSCYNLFTGVHLEHRGQGLAKALKLRATLYALGLGLSHIRTNNDSRNLPMIAINTALGYKREPGWHIFRKMLL